MYFSGLCSERPEAQTADVGSPQVAPQAGTGGGSKTLEPNLPHGGDGHVRDSVCHQPHCGCHAQDLAPGVHTLPVMDTGCRTEWLTYTCLQEFSP